jgi:hypothetical protein
LTLVSSDTHTDKEILEPRVQARRTQTLSLRVLQALMWSALSSEPQSDRLSSVHSSALYPVVALRAWRPVWATGTGRQHVFRAGNSL